MRAPAHMARRVRIAEGHMKRLMPAPLLLLMLVVGCTQQKGGPMPTHYEDALSQLNSATASKPGTKQSEAVSQALLPPLVVEMPRAEGKPGELSIQHAQGQERTARRLQLTVRFGAFISGQRGCGRQRPPGARRAGAGG